MPPKEAFQTVFEALKAILQKHEPDLLIIHDEPGDYLLNTPYSEKYRKEVFFGAVQIKKHYGAST